MIYKSKKKIISIVVLLVLISIPTGIFINKKLSNSGLDTNAVKWNQQENDDPESIKIPGYSTITIPSNTKNVQITLGNPEGNQCYFKFEVVVDG